MLIGRLKPRAVRSISSSARCGRTLRAEAERSALKTAPHFTPRRRSMKRLRRKPVSLGARSGSGGRITAAQAVLFRPQMSGRAYLSRVATIVRSSAYREFQYAAISRAVDHQHRAEDGRHGKATELDAEWLICGSDQVHARSLWRGANEADNGHNREPQEYWIAAGAGRYRDSAPCLKLLADFAVEAFGAELLDA